jgi:hypothetical protein
MYAVLKMQLRSRTLQLTLRNLQFGGKPDNKPEIAVHNEEKPTVLTDFKCQGRGGSDTPYATLTTSGVG